HRARLKEIRRIEAEGDAALEINAAGIEVEPIERLPAQVRFAKIVREVLAVRETESLLETQVQATAVRHAQRRAESPLAPHIEQPAFFPARRMWGWCRHEPAL